MAKTIGPSFSSELKAAGLDGLPFAWEANGTVLFGAVNDTQKAAILAVLAAHNPATPAPSSSDALDAVIDQINLILTKVNVAKAGTFDDLAKSRKK